MSWPKNVVVLSRICVWLVAVVAIKAQGQRGIYFAPLSGTYRLLMHGLTFGVHPCILLAKF